MPDKRCEMTPEQKLTLLYYLFSTAAQASAAVAGIVFVAAQFRVQWLDDRLTHAKDACGLDSRLTVSQTIRQAEVGPAAEKLKKYFDTIQKTRIDSKRMIKLQLWMMAAGIVQISSAPAFARLPGALFASYVALNTAAFIALTVRTIGISDESFIVKRRQASDQS